MKKLTIKQRVRKYRNNLTVTKKAEISRKNVVMQRKRRQKMNTEQRMTQRLHDAQRRKTIKGKKVQRETGLRQCKKCFEHEEQKSFKIN